MEYDLRSYDCGYCKNKFEEASPAYGGSIRCPKCKNYLKKQEGTFIKTIKAKTFLETRGHK